MAHFTLEQWADFARKTVKSNEEAKMQTHLEAGCKQCAGALQFCSRLREVSSRERTYSVPDEAVRTTKGMFKIAASSKTRLDVLFDSFLAPAAAGVRSATATARQLLYAAGAYRIDLRMEPQIDNDRVAVVGQVLNSADPSQMIPTMPVALIKNRKPISSAQTGNFGEFQLECKLSDRLLLQLRLPDGVGVEIPLLQPSKAALTGNLEASENRAVGTESSTERRGTSKKV